MDLLLYEIDFADRHGCAGAIRECPVVRMIALLKGLELSWLVCEKARACMSTDWQGLPYSHGNFIFTGTSHGLLKNQALFASVGSALLLKDLKVLPKHWQSPC